MNKLFLFIIFSVIFLTPFVRGDQIYYFNSSVGRNEYNHVSFTILRDIEFEIQGTSNGNISFLALDEMNYQKWLDLTNYSSIYQTPISGEYSFGFITALPVNSTLNMLFYNSGSNAVQIDITIDEIVATTDKSPIPLFPITISLTLILLTYRKSIDYR